MAKFLTTSGASYYIEQIIIKAKSNLTLLSPFIDMNTTIIERLKDADNRGVRIRYVYGKKKLPKQQEKVLASLANLEILFCKELHAKCYLNDSQMIITSMNLYEFSEKNNREMGMFLTKKEDEDIYGDALKEVESIINSSEIKKKPVTEELVELHPDFTEEHNFHQPHLLKLLQVKYPKFDVNIEGNDILIEHFPIMGMRLEVVRRIDFRFENGALYKNVSDAYREQLREKLPGIRFYWNRNILNIYPEENFKVGVDVEGIKELSSKFMKIITTTYDVITDNS